MASCLRTLFIASSLGVFVFAGCGGSDSGGGGDQDSGADVTLDASDATDGDGGDACPADAPFMCGTTCVAPFSVTSISPTSVCSVGTETMTVTGTGFHGAMTVTVGTTPATNVKVVSPTSLTFSEPGVLSSGAPYDVTVSLAEGCSAKLPGAITKVTDGTATVTSVDPKKGWIGIDNPITIDGTGFVSGATLELRGAATGGGDLGLTDVAFVSATQMKATVPAGGVAGGPYDLIYKPPTGCGSMLAKAFTLDGSPAITLTKVVPQFGWTGAKTPISVFGSGFVSTPRVFLDIGTKTPKLTLLSSTAFVTAGSITSVVPEGLPVGGPYDLVVINPDGGGGSLKAAFTVVSKPPPTVDNVVPAGGVVSVDEAVTITGCNFRASTTALVDSATPPVITPQTNAAPTCAATGSCPDGSGTCTMSATLKAPANGAFLVRVTDPDESTFGDFSAYVATNPSSKLETGFVTAKSLVTGRRSLVSVAGRINSASRFLYAIGGEQADGTVLDTVEVSPLDFFGAAGDWYAQRYKLNVARAGASAFQLGGYVYVLGGTSTKGGTGGAAPTGAPLDSIERAKILDHSDQPKLNDPTIGAGTLAKGTWLYEVSAVKGAADPDNPSGETLPSDEVAVALGAAGGVTLSWTAIPGATKYRVYRTAAVDGTSQTEVFLAESTTTSYTDGGSAAPDTTQTPLRPGSTGVWQTLGITLAHARFNANATMAPDPSGVVRVYVVGGHGACTTGGAAATMNCWEMASVTPDGKTLSAPVAGTTTMSVGRERLGVATMSADDGPPGYSASQAFVFASGGLGPTTSAASVEYASVDTAGVLTWKGIPGADFSPKAKDGSSLGIANGLAFAFAGGSPGSYTTNVKRAGPATITGATLSFASWSDAVSSVPTARGRFGFALESAYFYLVGGTTDDTDALTSVVQVIY